jgi:hypothetical protein
MEGIAVIVDVQSVAAEITENRARRAEKVRENRLRRMAQRQGLELRKSRTRDPRARDYGKYWLVDPFINNIVFGELPGEWRGNAANLDDIERYLTEGWIAKAST